MRVSSNVSTFYNWIISELNKNYSNKKNHLILFICLLGLMLDYSYLELFTKNPFGIHLWRQTDCLSLVWNYKNGASLFEPQILNLLSGSNKGVGEFPLFYYFVGKMSAIFGNDIFIYRLICFIFSIVGLLYLFKLINLFFQKFWWSLVIVLLFFTSPLYTIYAISFISDPIALSLFFVGCFHFFQYYYKSDEKHKYYAIIFFTLTCLLKISFIIHFMAILGTFFVFSMKKEHFFKFIKHYFLFALVIVINVIWIYWAKKYNATNENEYFSTKTWPMWDLTGEHINKIFTIIRDDWFSIILNKNLIYLFLPLGILQGIFIWFKSTNYLLKIFLFFSYTAVISYMLLWFFAFQNHDYYFIVLLPFLFFIISLLVYQITQLNKPKVQALLFLFMIIIVYTSSQHCKKIIKERTGETWMNEANYFTNLEGFDKTLDKLKISKNAKFFSTPDQSPNISLYHLKRKGVTDLYENTKDSSKIEKFIDLGVNYIIVNNMPTFKEELLYHYAGKKIYDKKGIQIYKVKTD